VNLAILDIQHGRKRDGAPVDPGAAYDLDGDGVVGETGEREIDITRAYVGAARVGLETVGLAVEVLDSGSYDERHVRACVLARGASWAGYIACHVNAGRGTYGLVKHDHRSIGGRKFATVLAEELVRAAVGLKPELTSAKVVPLTPSERGWSCIDGIYRGPAWLVGVLFEPGFIDTTSHRPLWTPAGVERIGAVLTRALVRASMS
jgi:hypothetical protein